MWAPKSRSKQHAMEDVGIRCSLMEAAGKVSTLLKTLLELKTVCTNLPEWSKWLPGHHMDHSKAFATSTFPWLCWACLLCSILLLQSLLGLLLLPAWHMRLLNSSERCTDYQAWNTASRKAIGMQDLYRTSSHPSSSSIIWIKKQDRKMLTRYA